MSDQPPYPPTGPGQDPNQPGWGQQPPPGGQPPPGQQPPGWGQQPPPPPGWTPPPGAPFGGAPRQLDAPTAIKYGWRAFQKHTGALLGVAAVALLVPIAIQVLGGVLAGGEVVSYEFSMEAGEDPTFDFNPLALAFNVAVSILAMILGAAATRVALDVVDGEQVSFGAAFSRINFGQVIVAAIILGIATTIGLMLCFLPGLVIAFLSYFTNYFIIGKNQDAIAAIKSSFKLVSSNVGPLLLLALLSALCMIGGVIACCVGMLVAYPVVTVATAYAFRFLHQEPIQQL